MLAGAALSIEAVLPESVYPPAIQVVDAAAAAAAAAYSRGALTAFRSVANITDSTAWVLLMTCFTASHETVMLLMKHWRPLQSLNMLHDGVNSNWCRSSALLRPPSYHLQYGPNC